MKHLLLIGAFTLSSAFVMAQTNGSTSGSSNSGTTTSKTTGSKKDSVTNAKTNHRKLPPNTAIHGGKVVSTVHGEHDYTPGSPIGTGGAGGTLMSGSQQGSASENAMGKVPSDELLEDSTQNKNHNDNVNRKQGQENKSFIETGEDRAPVIKNRNSTNAAKKNAGTRKTGSTQKRKP